MVAKDISNNWPEHLDTTLKNLNNHILPSLKYSTNELLLGLIINFCCTEFLEMIQPPTKNDIAVHLAVVKQQHLDGFTATVDHAAKHKDIFDAELRQRAPWNVVFQPGDLVQVHSTE